MLIFNDGAPRSGKTYDTVLNHILPALKAGRHVYARVDGLDHQAIAQHLRMTFKQVDDLLHHLDADHVVPLLQCTREGNSYHVAEELKNALVVIDEVHEFYPASMKSLPKNQEQFFARHGQFGMDIVAASQDFGAMHDDIRCRVERKVLFRKLSHFAALAKFGIGGAGRYSKRYYVSAGSGKFKEIKSEQHKYDATIYPLYRSFQPGVSNLETYDGGKVEAAGAGLKFYVPLAVVAGLVGIWFAFKVFDKDESPLLAQARAAQAQQPVSPPATAAVQAMPAGTGQAGVPLPVPTIKEEPKHSPGVAYVLDLAKEHRPRAAGVWTEQSGRRGGWVEFRSKQEHAADRLTLDDLEDLGFTVEAHGYGFVLRAEGQTIIATYWPLDEWGRVSERTNARVRGNGPGAGTRDSAATTGAEPPIEISGEQQHAYGAFRG